MAMWPPIPSSHPVPSQVKALIAGQEARMEGFSGHPRPTPKNLHVWLTQHPFAPALEKCSVKPWKGEWPKQTQGTGMD